LELLLVPAGRARRGLGGSSAKEERRMKERKKKGREKEDISLSFNYF